MKRLLFIIASCTFGVTAHAQITPADPNPKKVEEEKAVVAFTEQFYRTMETMVEAKDGNMEPLTKYIDKEFLFTRHILDVNNQLSKATSSLAEFKMQLNAQMSLSGLKVDYNVDRINFVMAYDNFATINYSVWVSASLNGEPMLRHRSHVTNYMRKDDHGNWKLYESSGVNIYKEQEMGWCPCSITKTGKDDTQFAVKILYPAGNSFGTDNLIFDFKGGEQKILIIVGENAYTMDKGEVICVRDKGNTVNIKLGKANAPVECINLIMSKHLYAARCTGFKAISKY